MASRCHSGKEYTCQGRRLKIPESGRSPGIGNDNPLQYSCLGNPIHRGVWQATVHGVTKSRTWLSMHSHNVVYQYIWFSLSPKAFADQNFHTTPLLQQYQVAKNLLRTYSVLSVLTLLLTEYTQFLDWHQMMLFFLNTQRRYLRKDSLCWDNRGKPHWGDILKSELEWWKGIS